MITKLFKESINDRNIFKCIFIAGGPGSGKSYISQLMFGVDLEINLSAYGAKVVNSDIIFEYNLKKYNLSSIIDSSNKDLYAKQMKIRELSKELSNKQLGGWIEGMLPLIIDGTGKDYNKITDLAVNMKSIGYDCSMIFVNTSLDVAKQRNLKRDRKVPPDIVEKYWKLTQENIGKFQNYFGQSNFIIVDNDKDLSNGEGKSFADRLFSIGNSIMNKPLQNIIGKNIIQYLNRTGGLYLSDLGKGKL